MSARALSVHRNGHRSRQIIERYYFPVASLLLLGLTLAGFWDNLFTDVGQSSNSDPKFIVHGLFCGAWIILLAAQTILICIGNPRLHRKVGVAAVVIAVGVAASTIWVFVAVWKGWAAMSDEAQANRILLPSFALCVGLGILSRRRSERHKRLLYVGTLFMLGPALARAYDPLFVPLMGSLTEAQIEAAFLPCFFAVWLAFFLSLFGYDAIVRRRIHPVTIAALSWFATIWMVALLT